MFVFSSFCFSFYHFCRLFSVSTRCPPCRQIAPVFEALARQYSPNVVFIKIDVDKFPKIKTILGVWAMPSFYFFKNQTQVGKFMGANESALRRGIQNDGNVGICSSCNIQ
jgi:thioredoxin 1